MFLFKLFCFFHENGCEFLQVQLAVLVDVIFLYKPVCIFSRDLNYFWFESGGFILGRGNIWSLSICELVLAILIKLVLQLQELVHGGVELVRADTLLIVSEQTVDF